MGVEPVNMRRVTQFYLAVAILGMWSFVQIINIWYSALGALWIHHVKTASCLKIEIFLGVGFSYWKTKKGNWWSCKDN